MRISASVLGAPEPRLLAEFYERLLGWTVAVAEPEWVMLKPPDGGTGLSFQLEDEYVPPVWPGTPGEQQMMVHLDIAVDDLDAGVAWAQDAGQVNVICSVQADWCGLAAVEFEKDTGIKTTIPFHNAIMRNADFRNGNYDTGFVDRLMNSEAFELRPSNGSLRD